jgi:hypothetical protein
MIRHGLGYDASDVLGGRKRGETGDCGEGFDREV